MAYDFGISTRVSSATSSVSTQTLSGDKKTETENDGKTIAPKKVSSTLLYIKEITRKAIRQVSRSNMSSTPPPIAASFPKSPNDVLKLFIKNHPDKQPASRAKLKSFIQEYKGITVQNNVDDIFSGKSTITNELDSLAKLATDTTDEQWDSLLYSTYSMGHTRGPFSSLNPLVKTSKSDDIQTIIATLSSVEELIKECPQEESETVATTLETLLTELRQASNAEHIEPDSIDSLNSKIESLNKESQIMFIRLSLNNTMESAQKSFNDAFGLGSVHTSNYSSTELIQIRQICRCIEDFPNDRIQAHDGSPPINSNAWQISTALDLVLPGAGSASRIDHTDFSMSQKKNIGSSQSAISQCLSPIQEQETFFGVSVKKVFKTIQFPFRLTAMITFGAADIASGTVSALYQGIKNQQSSSDLSMWDRFSQGGQTRKSFYDQKIRPRYKAIASSLSRLTGFETFMRLHKSLEHKTIAKLNNKFQQITLEPEGNKRQTIINAAKEDVTTLFNENKVHKEEIKQKEAEYAKRFGNQPPKTIPEIQKEITGINNEIESLKQEDSQAAGVKSSERKPISALVDSYVKPLSDAYKTGKAQTLPIVNFVHRTIGSGSKDVHNDLMNLRMRKNDLQGLADQKNKVFSIDKRLCGISIGLDTVEGNTLSTPPLDVESKLDQLFEEHNIQGSDSRCIKNELLSDQKIKQEAFSFLTEFNESMAYFYNDGQTLTLPDLPIKAKESLERLLIDIHQNPDNFSADSISEERLNSLESLMQTQDPGFNNALTTIIKFVKKNSFLGTLRSKDQAVISHFSSMVMLEYGLALGMGGGMGLVEKGASSLGNSLQLGSRMAIAMGASVQKFFSSQVATSVGIIKSNRSKRTVQNKIDHAADLTATFVQDRLMSRLTERLRPVDGVQTNRPSASTPVKPMTLRRLFKKGASSMGRRVGFQTVSHIKKKYESQDDTPSDVSTLNTSKSDPTPKSSQDVSDSVMDQKRTQLYKFLIKKERFDALVMGTAKKEDTKDCLNFEETRIALIKMEEGEGGFSNELDTISSDRTMMSILRSELLAAKQEFDEVPDQTVSSFFDSFDRTMKTSCPEGGGIAELVLIPLYKQSFFLKKAGVSTQG